MMLSAARVLRRSALPALVAALAVPAAGAALDLAKPDDAVKAMRKFQSSLKDGKPTIFWFQGNVYSRVPGEKDRQLFTYQALNIRASQTLSEPGRGYGYRLVSRELLLYLDPKTKEVLRIWKNPWTNQEVEVVHIANDPVTMRPTFAQGPQGPYQFGGTVKDGWGNYSIEVPLFYPNPLGGDYQPYVGGTYQAMEMFNFFFPAGELMGPSDEVDDVSVAWARVAQWLPWMEMGDRHGYMLYSGAGRRIASYDQLPEVLKKEIEANYPIYKTPPPLDDNRPNETSWTYFKKWIDAKRKAQPPKP